jgi:hypothetical protein
MRSFVMTYGGTCVDVWWNVWCFAEEEDAEKFRARFGGEFMEPADRPRWAGREDNFNPSAEHRSEISNDI